MNKKNFEKLPLLFATVCMVGCPKAQAPVAGDDLGGMCGDGGITGTGNLRNPVAVHVWDCSDTAPQGNPPANDYPDSWSSGLQPGLPTAPESEARMLPSGILNSRLFRRRMITTQSCNTSQLWTQRMRATTLGIVAPTTI